MSTQINSDNDPNSGSSETQSPTVVVGSNTICQTCGNQLPRAKIDWPDIPDSLRIEIVPSDTQLDSQTPQDVTPSGRKREQKYLVLQNKKRPLIPRKNTQQDGKTVFELIVCLEPMQDLNNAQIQKQKMTIEVRDTSNKVLSRWTTSDGSAVMKCYCKTCNIYSSPSTEATQSQTYSLVLSDPSGNDQGFVNLTHEQFELFSKDNECLYKISRRGSSDGKKYRIKAERGVGLSAHGKLTSVDPSTVEVILPATKDNNPEAKLIVLAGVFCLQFMHAALYALPVFK